MRHGIGRTRAFASAAIAAAAIAGGTSAIIDTAPAAAGMTGCSWGYNNAKTAWGHCNGGSGSWSLTVTCYKAPSHTSYGNAPGSIYASCNSTYITGVSLWHS